jgi:hypothetical protein
MSYSRLGIAQAALRSCLRLLCWVRFYGSFQGSGLVMEGEVEGGGGGMLGYFSIQLGRDL